MGESACLRRSFSDSSSDPRMGDAIRALGDSISFGRFMSETLAWEKWSSFSQNRYLEEAEKFSKPGSVAQKKAYFEAHYKRIAAKKAAEAEAEAEAEASPPANNLPEPEASSSNEIHKTSSYDNSPMTTEESGGQEALNTDTVVDEIHNTSSDELDTNRENSPMIIDEQEEAPNSQLVVDRAENTEELEEVEEVEEVEVVEAEPVMIVPDPPAQVEFSDQNENIEEDRMMPLEAADDEEKNKANKKLPKSSSKSSAQGRAGASKLGASPANARKENNPPASTKKKPAQDAMDKKKRVTPKSLHMSINFASLAGETSRKASPLLQNNRNSRISTISTKITKESTTPIQSTIRASMNGIPKHTSAATSTLENRRARTLLDRSVSGNRTAEEKWQSLLAERPQPPVIACGSKSRSPIISSPFRFRSEERVAKRKEFFQKLEEKNAKEAENMQLRTKSSKEKPESDLKKVRCSVTFKAMPTTDSCRETESSSNHTRKDKGESELKKLRHSITFKLGSCPETGSPGNHMMKEKGKAELKKMRHSITFRPGSYHETDSPGSNQKIKKTPSKTRPWSPKLGRKLTPSVVQDTNSRPPRLPSARTDSSKPATEKNKLLLPKKISQENASPNIQL